MEHTPMGMDGVRYLKRVARVLSESSRFARLEVGCWLVELALGGSDWWLSVKVRPGTEPSAQDWYTLGWTVAALGASPTSREATFSLEAPFTWEWIAEPCMDCGEMAPTHLVGCPVDQTT